MWTSTDLADDVRANIRFHPKAREKLFWFRHELSSLEGGSHHVLSSDLTRSSAFISHFDLAHALDDNIYLFRKFILSTMPSLNQSTSKRLRTAITLGLWASSSWGSSAFLISSPTTTPHSVRKERMQRSLYVDLKSNGEYSREVIESSKTNEWGIPDSRTLEPLSTDVVDQLDNGGKITLVGSGPGDPDLLTVKALKLLQDPDALVICDRLVSQEIVDLVQGEIKVARKLPGCAELAQEEIYFWTHQGLRAGKHVIRLKIGDPFVFGRGGEEILTFRKFGVESTVVPVSSYFFCRSYPYRWLAGEDSAQLYFFVAITSGRFGCLFSSAARQYPCHTQGSIQSGSHVHRLRTRRNLSGFDSISQGANSGILDGCR